MGRWDGSKFAEKKRRKEFLLVGLAGGAGLIALTALGVSEKTTGGGGGVSLTPPKIPFASAGHVLSDSQSQYIAADPSISPTSNNTVDLGSTTFNWRDIHSLGQANLDHVFIQPATTLVQPLVVRPAAGSGENIFEVDDATNTNVWLYINPSGITHIAKLNIDSTFSLSPGVSVPSPPFVITNPTASSQNVISPATSAVPALQIMDAGTSSGSPFIEINNSGGNQVWRWLSSTLTLVGGAFDTFGSSAALILQRSATTSPALITESQSDFVARFSLFQSGQMGWGTGVNTAQDTELERTAAGVLKINLTSALIAPPANTRAALALEGNETSHIERRLRNDAGKISITNSANVGITQISPPLGSTPVAVNATGQTAGVSNQLPHTDHQHQLANPITGAVQLNIETGDSVSLFPILMNDLNSGVTSYGFGVAARFEGGGADSTFGGTNSIDIAPSVPAIFWNLTSNMLNTLGLANLVVVNVNDIPQLFHMLSLDYSGGFTGSAHGVLWGDDGSFGGTPTADMVFACVSGSTFNFSEFTGGQVLPVKGINEAAPGGAATTKAITFAVAQSNATYGIEVTPQGNCEIWVTGKLTTGFTLNYSVAGGVACDWELYR